MTSKATEQVYIHFTDLAGARGMNTTKTLWKASYIDSVWAVPVGGAYEPGVQRTTMGRAKNRNVAVYFTTTEMPDYCNPEECVWRQKEIPIVVKKIGLAQNAIKFLDKSLIASDGETVNILTKQNHPTKFPELKTLFWPSDDDNVVSEAPEASPDDIFGISLDDPNKRKPEKKPPEVNTWLEKQLLSLLDKHFNVISDSPAIGRFLMQYVKPAIKAGKYPQLKPKPGLVYRGISLKRKAFQNLVQLSSQEVTEQPNTGWFVGSSGILNPPGKSEMSTSSWTTDPKTAVGFSTESAVDEGDVMVVFIADTREPKNNFFLNPEKLVGLYKSSNKTYSDFASPQYKDEKEVIGVGPVVFKELVFYFSTDTEDPTYSKTTDSPQWPEFAGIFARKLQQELANPRSFQNSQARETLTRKVIFQTIAYLIRKYKWKTLGKGMNASEYLFQVVADFNYDWTAESRTNATLEQWISGLLRAFQREPNVFPKEVLAYDAEQSLLYSLGLRKKEPKPERVIH